MFEMYGVYYSSTASIVFAVCVMYSRYQHEGHFSEGVAYVTPLYIFMVLPFLILKPFVPSLSLAFGEGCIGVMTRPSESGPVIKRQFDSVDDRVLDIRNRSTIKHTPTLPPHCQALKSRYQDFVGQNHE